jgi:hypothetical protein
MAVRIRLSDGSAFVVASSYSDLREAIERAIREDLPLLEVRNGNGQMRSINPRQISFIEETDDDALTPEEEEVLQAVEERRGRPQ